MPGAAHPAFYESAMNRQSSLLSIPAKPESNSVKAGALLDRVGTARHFPAYPVLC
jgi:hypothetical protein